jgi:hypothetical protein
MPPIERDRARRDEPHPLVLSDHEQAVAVVLDLMEPVFAGRYGFAGSRDAELN